VVLVGVLGGSVVWGLGISVAVSLLLVSPPLGDQTYSSMARRVNRL